MYKIIGMRYTTDVAVSAGQIPTSAIITVELEDAAGNRLYGMRSHIDEAGGDDLVYVGPEAMYELWEKFHSDEIADMRVDDSLELMDAMDSAAYISMDIGVEGETVTKYDAKYANIVQLTGEMMEEFLRDGKCRDRIGEVLDRRDNVSIIEAWGTTLLL